MTALLCFNNLICLSFEIILTGHHPVFLPSSFWKNVSFVSDRFIAFYHPFPAIASNVFPQEIAGLMKGLSTILLFMFMRIRDKTANFRNSMLRLKSSRRKKITFTRELQIAFPETWNAKRKSPSVFWRHPRCQIVSFSKKIEYPEYLFVFVHSFCSLNWFPFHHQQNDMFGTTTSNLPFLRLPTALSVDAFRDPTRTILWCQPGTHQGQDGESWWIWSYSYLYKYVEIKFRFIGHRHFHIHLNSIWFQICIHINIPWIASWRSHGHSLLVPKHTVCSFQNPQIIVKLTRICWSWHHFLQMGKVCCIFAWSEKPEQIPPCFSFSSTIPNATSKLGLFRVPLDRLPNWILG